MNISIFGFGRVGVALGASLASKGHSVIGVDVDDHIINSVNKSVAPFPETNLDVFLKKYGKNIRATKDYAEAIKHTDLSFILVPTPSTADGSFDNRYIYKVFEGAVKHIKEKKRSHFFVVASTVSPQSMEGFWSYLEQQGLKGGKDFHLCYNPAFIRQGSVIKDFLYPDVVLIGGPEEKASQALKELWAGTVENDAYFITTNYLNAEIGKITLNTFATVKMSFANFVSALCEQHEGAHADVVMTVIKESGQIVGKKLLSGGLGYGGPCLPRDNNALRAFARFPEEVDLGKVVDAINHSVVDRVIKKIESIYEKGDRIGILGLAYKPGTYITTESQALQIANILANKYPNVKIYDPMAKERTSESKEDVVENSDIILLLTPWPEFLEIPIEKLKTKKVYDAWRFWEGKMKGQKNYFALGTYSH